MQEDSRYQGVWFLPDSPDKTVSGELIYSPENGTSLKLLGLFETEDAEIRSVPLINGISVDGKRITLYKCYQFQRGFNSKSFSTSTYDALYLFIGDTLISSIKELKFSHISTLYADFDNWLEVWGFEKFNNNKSSKELSLKYHQPQDLTFKASEKINCIFQFDSSFPYHNLISTAEIKQECRVVISADNEPKDFKTLMNWHAQFTRFLTLAYFGHPLLKSVIVATEKTSDKGHEYLEKMDVYYALSYKRGYKERKHHFAFLFQYETIRDNFESILQKWYAAEETIEPCIGGLTESFMSRDQPVEFKFLNLAHAIETFHRRTQEGKVLPLQDFKAKVLDILSGVKEEYKEWLKKALEFSNEIPLQQRLENLVGLVPLSIQSPLFKPSVPEFIKKVKQSRNYYTHYDKSGVKQALQGSDLFYMTERLKIFLICIILKHIGFTDSEIEKTIIRKGVYLFNHILPYNEVETLFSELDRNAQIDKD